jgi:hypothetical protein
MPIRIVCCVEVGGKPFSRANAAVAFVMDFP